MSSDRWLRDPHTFQGRLELRPFASAALEGNPLGDPHEREVPVYVPPQAADGPLPVVFLLVGFTGKPHALLETHPWKAGVVQGLDRAMAAGEHPPHLIVMPDAWTRLGGSQYVNGAATGRYEDYVADELVQWVDEHYPSNGRRAVVGKSSGGFGALRLAMRRPGVFHACGSIAGDCHFEYCYAPDFLNALRGLEQYGGDVARFLEAFEDGHDLSGDAHAVLNTVAMATCYSGGELPFEPETGARRDDVWARWLEFDPVVVCERYAEALRGLELLYLEAGKSDEFHLQFGLRVLVRRLESLGIPHEHVEFEGGHFGLNGRYPEVLRRLVEAL
ncbi:MAG: alpha/beta hydrolase-fold protein [Planctomycetota bacterium]|nr:alpha/beta hydrolase-fold protein [Planctomycetota bacterium]